MVDKLRVSRHGLTPCPNCKAHVRLSATPEPTRCVFCGTAVTASGTTDAASALGRFLHQGRSSLLAASLLGLGTVAACDTDEGTPVAEDGFVADADPETTQPDVQVIEDVPATDVYGSPPDTFADAETEVTEIDAPLYGSPPDVTEPDASGEDTPIADEGPLPQPLYGLPPMDAGPTPDADEDADVREDTTNEDDVVFVPLYGVPPSELPEKE